MKYRGTTPEKTQQGKLPKYRHNQIQYYKNKRLQKMLSWTMYHSGTLSNAEQCGSKCIETTKIFKEGDLQLDF